MQPVKGVAYTFNVSLPDSSVGGALKANPTLAAGDVKVSGDNGALANLTTLPTVEPAAGRIVKVALSASEMTADRVTVQFVDQTVPKEWDEVMVHIPTIPGDAFDALMVTAQAEPGQGTPAANATLATKIAYLFKAWRNRFTQTATQYKLFNDDAVTVDHKAATADDGTTFDRGEVASGP